MRTNGVFLTKKNALDEFPTKINTKITVMVHVCKILTQRVMLIHILILASFLRFENTIISHFDPPSKSAILKPKICEIEYSLHIFAMIAVGMTKR